jgi:hypothetical protein
MGMGRIIKEFQKLKIKLKLLLQVVRETESFTLGKKMHFSWTLKYSVTDLICCRVGPDMTVRREISVSAGIRADPLSSYFSDKGVWFINLNQLTHHALRNIARKNFQ